MAMGCCRWKSGECLKSLSGNSCPKVEDPKPPLSCDDDDTCCYFSCDVMKLDPGPQITQKGNCGADCTVAVLPDYRGNKFPELFLIPDGLLHRRKLLCIWRWSNGCTGDKHEYV